MLANERQQKIYEMICEKDAVSTSDLVKRLTVSVETVRRDLLELEGKRLLKRVHGGAIKSGDMRQFFELEERHKSREAEKRELTKVAMSVVQERDIISIDSGSTAIFFANALKENFSSLTVVTHSLDVFEILHEHKSFNVILCAGNYMKKENAFYGLLTMETLKQLYVKKAFICPSAVSLENGIYDYQPDLCMIQRKYMSISDKIYILADSSKYEKRALIKLGDMRPEYTYITDHNLKSDLKMMYLESGMQVLTEE